MAITKGIFTAVMLAKKAVDEDPQDPMRVQSAMQHLEFMVTFARLAEIQHIGEENARTQR